MSECKECVKLKYMYDSAKKQTDAHAETIIRMRKEAEECDERCRHLLGDEVEKNQVLREKIESFGVQVEAAQDVFSRVIQRAKGVTWGVRLVHIVYLSIIAYMYWG